MKYKSNKKRYTKPLIQKTKISMEFFYSNHNNINFNTNEDSLLEAHWSGRSWST